MKKTVIHWPALWRFFTRKTWAFLLVIAFFFGLASIVATVYFAWNSGYFAPLTVFCAVLTLASIAAFIFCQRRLVNEYYIELLDKSGTIIDAHIVDKLFAGHSVKGAGRAEIGRLRAENTEVTDDLYQIRYRYRVENKEYTKTYSVQYDKIFDSLEITQRILVKILPSRPYMVKVDEDYLMKQYREQMMDKWLDPDLILFGDQAKSDR